MKKGLFVLISISFLIALTSTTSALEGDVNNDGNVTIQDILVIVNDFGKTSGFNPAVDMAPPIGQIDIFDVMVVVRNWGRSDSDTAAPIISSVSASPSSTSATITWNTNEPSNSQVEYGLTTSYGSSTVLNPSMITSHSQIISGLTTGLLYHYRVKSRDASNNLATSGDFTFTTSAAALSFATTSMGSCVQGTFYSKTFTASGGSPPYTFTRISGAQFPAWSTFVSPTLSGNNPTVGTTNFRMRVTDLLGAFVERDFTLNCVAPGSGPHAFFDTLCSRDDVLKADTTVAGTIYPNVPRCWSLRPDPAQTVNSEAAGTGIYNPRWAYQLNDAAAPTPRVQRGYAKTEPIGPNIRSFLGYQYSAVTCDKDGKIPGNSCDYRPDAQDAMKLIFPPFINHSGTTLAASVGASDTNIPITNPVGPKLNAAWKMCNEIIKIVDNNEPSTVITNVTRGQFGTIAAPCPAGSPLYKAYSDPFSHIDWEINTKSGADSQHDYLLIYDFYATPSFKKLGSWHFKTLYIYSGSGNAWLLPIWDLDVPNNPYRPLDYDPEVHIGAVSWRTGGLRECPVGNCSYDQLPPSDQGYAGPGVTPGSFPQPIVPNSGFAIMPGKWTRVFILFEQKIDDYDDISIWIGDEDRVPVKMWDKLALTLADGVKAKEDDGSPNNLDSMHIGWDTSFNGLARSPECDMTTYQIGDFDHEDCVMALYLRNFVILEDPADIDLLVTQKPVG